MTKAQEVALWASLAAFCGSVISVAAFDLLSVDGGWVEFTLALLVSAVTGGAVYARERLNFAKQRANGDARENDDPPPPPNPRRKKMTETPAPPAPAPDPEPEPDPDSD